MHYYFDSNLTLSYLTHTRSLARPIPGTQRKGLKEKTFLSYTRKSPHSQRTKRYLWAR